MEVPTSEAKEIEEKAQIEDAEVTPAALHDPWDFPSRSEDSHRGLEKLLWKVDLRLLPMLCLMFLMSYLDRR